MGRLAAGPEEIEGDSGEDRRDREQGFHRPLECRVARDEQRGRDVGKGNPGVAGHPIRSVQVGLPHAQHDHRPDRQRAEQSGGKVIVESADGKGTTLVIQIPVDETAVKFVTNIIYVVICINMGYINL